MKKASVLQFRPNADKATNTVPAFYKDAKVLRNYFNETFQNPLEAKQARFCWDYWNVKNQYRLLRTPAESFFPEKIFQPFLSHLLTWGRENLGCQMISHPWLSSYIDGSYQNLHSDVPHGPFSFVYSLTPWNTRKFSGGETLVAKPKLLRYFSELEANDSHEEKHLFTRIAPKFNQLTLFDPRYPHGVDRVNGVEDVLDSRLVIHGWFTEPRPMLEGSLSVKKVSLGMDELAESISAILAPTSYRGLLTVRFKIEKNGSIGNITVLTSHLVDALGNTIPKTLLKKSLKVSHVRFPSASSTTIITLPLQYN